MSEVDQVGSKDFAASIPELPDNAQKKKSFLERMREREERQSKVKLSPSNVVKDHVDNLKRRNILSKKAGDEEKAEKIRSSSQETGELGFISISDHLPKSSETAKNVRKRTPHDRKSEKCVKFLFSSEDDSDDPPSKVKLRKTRVKPILRLAKDDQVQVRPVKVVNIKDSEMTLIKSLEVYRDELKQGTLMKDEIAECGGNLHSKSPKSNIHPSKSLTELSVVGTPHKTENVSLFIRQNKNSKLYTAKFQVEDSFSPDDPMKLSEEINGDITPPDHDAVPKLSEEVNSEADLNCSVDMFSDVQDAVDSSFDRISRLLISLGGFEGIGKWISPLIPGYEGFADRVAAFLLFIYNRQVIWRNRKENLPLTNNEIFGTKWFTNMYREVDRGTMYFRSNLLETVLNKNKGLTAGGINLKLLKEALYKSIVYRLVNKIKTFKGFGNIPNVADWSKFSDYIKEKRKRKETIFTAAHQNMGLDRFHETMNWVNKNIQSIANKIAAQAGERSLKGCFEVIHSIKNVGTFFAWQILCDLLENRLLGKCTDNQWTVLGPGAKNGLRIIFDHVGDRDELGMTRMLRDLCIKEGPNSGFQALGKTFPAFLNQNLSLKNVEHAMCEFFKYYKWALGLKGKERQYNERTSRVAQDKKLMCCVCGENSKTKKKFLCVLCNRCFHLNCLVQTKPSPSSESFLCDQCEVNVDLWKKEDFDFDEVDSN